MTNTLPTMRALAFTLVATTALVSACGGSSGEPKTLPPAPTSPAAPSPSAVPTGQDAPTPEGAAAFARYFYAQVERAFATADPALVAGISTASCTTCSSYVRSLTKLRDGHERVEGFNIQIQDAVAPAGTAGAARVDVIWSHGAVTRYDASGRVIRREPAEQGVEEQVNLVRAATGWRVAEVLRIRVRRTG